METWAVVCRRSPPDVTNSFFDSEMFSVIHAKLGLQSTRRITTITLARPIGLAAHLIRIFSFNGRHYHAAHTAEILNQRADVVEHCQLTAADVGRLLDERATADLNPTAQRELRELRLSTSDSAQFAAGLRRQAAMLSSSYAAAMESATRK